jgi:asparagine synthase (glutamine-hydrolysing)
MCGIVGFVHLDGSQLSNDREAPLLRRLAGKIAHRGPDDEQIFIWKNVGLGFRRLAIVDPAGGQQPLFNEDRTVALICNGEIYNHREIRSSSASDRRFRTGSDCEVIAHLYDRMGMNHLDLLNGIFAFALLDMTRRKLFLCRDRLGVKPLFYYKNDAILVFGSEVKAVLAHPAVPKQFDWAEALTFRNRMHYPHRAHELTSFFNGIHQLAAGHFLEIDLATGESQEHVYWDPPGSAGERHGNTDCAAYISRYRDLLEDAVRMQLMADVECGVFLSGGIDSLSVAHFASKHMPLHTFSVLSQSTLTNGDAPTAHAAAKSFNLPNHMVRYDWQDRDITPSLWRTILWMVETPIAGAEQFYKYLLHAHARAQVPGLKVMLLGSGSDEFNGGYSKSVFNSKEAPSWQTFEEILKGYERDSLLQLSGAWNVYANTRMNGQPLISPDFLAGLASEQRYEPPWHGYREMYRRMLQMYQLWHEDRTSAAHGIEARVPFLDHRLVELTYSVPAELHQDLFWDKRILREAMKDSLADQFCQRPKTPFFYGEDIRYTRRLMYNLLCASKRALVEEALDAGADIERVVNRDALWKMFDTLPDDPEYSNMDIALDIVNMGLLAGMAKMQAEPQRWDGQLPVSEVLIDDWPAWQQQDSISLVRRAPALGQDSIVRFADGIRLVKSEAGDPRLADEGGYYILRNNNLEFALERDLESWIRFLQSVDGARSVKQILQLADIAGSEIWKHLEEALEYDVLNVTRAVDETSGSEFEALPPRLAN